MNPAQGPDAQRAFVLDTNVLMHDPAAIFRFEEHDIYLPMIVLEELDAGKKGLSEAARSVRQVSRFLDELMADATKEQIDGGLELPSGRGENHGKKKPTGRLFFQTRRLDTGLPDSLPGHGADNSILGYTLALQGELPGSRITLVSKDINLRIKAAILGVHAEDYYSDRTIEDADLLFRGISELPADFWDTHGSDVESWQEQARTFYRVRGPLVAGWKLNQFVCEAADDGLEAIVRSIDDGVAVLEVTEDHRNARHAVWGITARNRDIADIGIDRHQPIGVADDQNGDLVGTLGDGCHLAVACGAHGCPAGGCNVDPLIVAPIGADDVTRDRLGKTGGAGGLRGRCRLCGRWWCRYRGCACLLW